MSVILTNIAPFHQFLVSFDFIYWVFVMQICFVFKNELYELLCLVLYYKSFFYFKS